MSQRDAFDPRYWLQRWREAGGGWANTTLMLFDGDTIALNRLAQELNDDRREMLRQHLADTGISSSD